MIIELLTEIVRNLLVEHDMLAVVGLGSGLCCTERPQIFDGKLLIEARRVDFNPPAAPLFPH